MSQFFFRSRIPQQKPNPDLLNTSSTTEDSEYNNRASSRTSTHRSDPVYFRKYSVATCGLEWLQRFRKSTKLFKYSLFSAVLRIRIGFNSDLDRDPDPAFFVNADPDTGPDPDPGF
jgi:hypothetical protein